MAQKGPNKDPATPGPRALRARTTPLPQSTTQTRRTSEQVRHEKSEKDKAKQEKKEARSSMVRNVAHIEASLIEEDARMLAQAHHPPQSTRKKTKRSPPQPVLQGGGTSANQGPIDGVDDEIDQQLARIQSTADFAPDNAMKLTNSDDEPDTSAISAPQHSNNLEGASVRALVTATRHAGAVSNVASEEDNLAHKRKASASSAD
ncbi:hypothetical protein H0H93_014082 [Arthromyces matolae]|nr:hypothetical protein H0H93_014082 [Arthromyces matolae]